MREHEQYQGESHILFQNDDFLVINKRCGETVNLQLLGKQTDALGSLHALPVHRLDTPVSGCLLLAKTPQAAAFLSAAFARHDEIVKKCYWAIVEMPPEGSNVLPPEGELVHWLYENRKANKSFAIPAVSQTGKDDPPPPNRGIRPKKAVSRYRLAGKGERYLFLEIDLITGRHHQIRSQLAALGLRVKGDLKYGARRSEKAGGIRLHAYSLAFPNPLNPSEIITVKALPPEMDPLWTAFSENGYNT